MSHLWKYHHVLLLRPAGFKRPCLQLQTEHPFIRTARSDRTDVFSSSYSSPDINGVVCFSYTCPVLRVCNNWICCCFWLQLLSQLVPTVTGDATVARKWRHIMQCKFHLWLWGSYCFCRACALGSPLGGALALTGVSLGCVKGVEDASGHVNSALSFTEMLLCLFPSRKFNHICEQTRFKSWRITVVWVFFCHT